MNSKIVLANLLVLTSCSNIAFQKKIVSAVVANETSIADERAKCVHDNLEKMLTKGWPGSISKKKQIAVETYLKELTLLRDVSKRDTLSCPLSLPKMRGPSMIALEEDVSEEDTARYISVRLINEKDQFKKSQKFLRAALNYQADFQKMKLSWDTLMLIQQEKQRCITEQIKIDIEQRKLVAEQKGKVMEAGIKVKVAFRKAHRFVLANGAIPCN